MTLTSHRVLPGFRLSLGITLGYLTLLVFVPLGACIAKAAGLGWHGFFAAAWTPRARAAYALTFGAAASAAVIDVVLGVVVAWVLVRHDFRGKRFVDALVDLPIALPTAVAGLVYSSLYAPNGWLGRFLVPLGVEGAYSRLAIVLVLVFIGLPLVVRTVQPVLQDLDPDLEEAAASLGASRGQAFRRVIAPTLLPGVTTGFALALARGLGEYGSVVFVSGNMPFRTEIAPVLIVAALEEFRYREAAAIAVVLLAGSIALLVLVQWLERRSRRHEA
jgi:sulfate transport system permease protein